jgi:DNA-binding response OmpR family regulator
MLRACWKFLVFGVILCPAAWQAEVVSAQPADESPAAAADDAPAKVVEETTLDDSPLLQQPKTPEESFDAVLLMVKLARPKLAKLYLAQVLNPKPTDELLLRLHDKHGPAVFLQLSNILDLRPLSTQLLDLVNQAFRKRGADPVRIDGLIADLSGTAQQREVALIALRSAGPVVVPRILQRMGQPDDARQRDLLLYTLTRMGRQIVPALLGALEAPSDDIRGVAIHALGRLGAREAIPYLWYPAEGPQQSTGIRTAARDALARILVASEKNVGRVSRFGVRDELKRIALIHFRNQHRWSTEDDGTVALWSWQPQTATVHLRQLSPQAASLYVGARFARQALALSPEETAIQALYLGFALAIDRHRVGWEEPLPTGPGTTHDLALSLGDEVLNQALSQALEYGRADAAIASLQVLSQTATRHQLNEQQRRRAPIVAALNYPDPRVQFAAAVTVLQLDPVESFRSSARVVNILTRALNDNGAPGALVVHTNIEQARGIGGFLGELGFEPYVAPTGKDAFHIAAERADIDLIVLEINTIRWGLSQTIGNLRADARTSHIPIVIFGPDGMQSSVSGLLNRHSLMKYIVTPATSDSLRSQVAPFLATFTTPTLTAQQRGARLKTAAYWFAHIAAGKRTKIFNIAPAETTLISALNDPDLVENALQALSAIPTKSVQERFAVLAVTENADPRLRESAALQLAFHIQRFGAMLDEKTVLAVYTGWKSAGDADLSTALASVLGSLKPNAKRVGQRLGNFPEPPLTAPKAASPPGS